MLNAEPRLTAPPSPNSPDGARRAAKTGRIDAFWLAHYHSPAHGGGNGSGPVRKPLAILLIATVVLAGLLAGAGVLLYQATRAMPTFYEQVLAQDVEHQQQASEEFLQQATALASDVETQEAWSVAFTDEQINGWLAVDVPRNLPQAIPPTIQAPRVSIKPGEATIAFRLKTAALDAVVSVAVDVFLSAPNEVAVRFRHASLGRLPVPLAKVIEPVGQAAAQLNLHLVWRQQGGDPVAVVALDHNTNANDRDVNLEAIELAEGELRIAGVSRKRDEPSALAQGVAAVLKSASATRTKLQR